MVNLSEDEIGDDTKIFEKLSEKMNLEKESFDELMGKAIEKTENYFEEFLEKNNNDEFTFKKITNSIGILQVYLNKLKYDDKFMNDLLFCKFKMLLPKNPTTECDLKQELIDLIFNGTTSGDLRSAIYILITYYLDTEILFKSQPYLKEDIYIYQYISAIYENVLFFTAIVEEYYKTVGIDKLVRLCDNVDWAFDNPNNPIEIKLNFFLEKNPQITKNNKQLLDENNNIPSVNLLIEQYYELLKMTFNFEKIITEINKNYSIDMVRELLQLVSEDTNFNKELVIMIIIVDFLANCINTDYLM